MFQKGSIRYYLRALSCWILKLMDDDNGESRIVALYFSKELKVPFTEEGTSRSKGKKEDPQEVQAKAELNRNRGVDYFKLYCI